MLEAQGSRFERILDSIDFLTAVLIVLPVFLFVLGGLAVLCWRCLWWLLIGQIPLRFAAR